MGPKPFWGDAFKGGSPVARELQSDDPEQGRTVRGRAPALILLLALALAFGFVPALEDRTPQRGSFPLPPASTSDAPQRRDAEKKGRTTAAAPAAEEKSAVPAIQSQAAPESSPSSAPTAAPPAAEASPLVSVPEVSEVLDEVVALVPPPDLGGAIALPAPVG